MSTTRIVFIGGGNMSRALVEGLVDDDRLSIGVSDPGATAREQLEHIENIDIYSDNEQAALNAEVLVFAVKPQIMQAVCKDLASIVAASSPLLVSVAAGITGDQIGQWLDKYNRIVRVMPNTPALIGCGAAGIYAMSGVSDEDRELVSRLIESVGLGIWVETEAQIDAVTALSGSGPAYFFRFLEHLESTAVELGLGVEQAQSLARQTALGAALMALKEDNGLAELRERVTSPGGTTAAALQSFDTDEFGAMVQRALQAAYHRAEELAEEFGGKNNL